MTDSDRRRRSVTARGRRDGVVVHLDEEEAVVEAMLEGWVRWQRARDVSLGIVRQRNYAVRRFMSYTNEYPWHWTIAHLDEWTLDLVSTRARAVSTIRNYHDALRSFETYLLAPQYGWAEECYARFGTHPTRICCDFNTSAHLRDGDEQERRPLTREELRCLLDHADAQADKAIHVGRRAGLVARRNAAIFKVMYAWGLRNREVSMLDVTDFYRNPHAPELGRYGMLEVRFGKSPRGSRPKRRTVLTVMPWVVEVIADYLTTVRPQFPNSDTPALWLSVRGHRLHPRSIVGHFATYRDSLGLPGDLVPHCLRHSYVTHLIEDGLDPVFVQHQVGHVYQSTTAHYTKVSNQFMDAMMRKVVNRALRK